MVTHGEDVSRLPAPRPRLPGKQVSMPVKYSNERPQLPSRQVSFNEQVEEWETYEKYTNYFSEYDRRSIHRQKRMSKSDVEGIYSDLQNLRLELFPEGDFFRDKNAHPHKADGDIGNNGGLRDDGEEGLGLVGKKGGMDLSNNEDLRDELRKYLLGDGENDDDSALSDTSRAGSDSGWSDS